MRKMFGLLVFFAGVAAAQTTNVTVTVTFPNAAIADVLAWNKTQVAQSGSTLSGDITSGSNTFTLSAAGSYTAGTFLIDNEEIACTTLTGSVLTGCTRGQMSTAAAAHTSGASVSQLKYGTTAALVKALLAPGIQSAISSLGVNSTYIASLQATIASAQAALAAAQASAVQ